MVSEEITGHSVVHHAKKVRVFCKGFEKAYYYDVYHDGSVKCECGGINCTHVEYVLQLLGLRQRSFNETLATRVKEMAKKKLGALTPEELKEQLGKLKDREARLEADLAIREYPELEEPITQIILVMVEVKKAKDALKVADRPVGPESKEVDALSMQIRYHEGKIAALKARLTDIMGEKGAEVGKLNQKKVQTIEELQRIYDSWSDTLAEHDVHILRLLPSLQDHIKVVPETT